MSHRICSFCLKSPGPRKNWDLDLYTQSLQAVAFSPNPGGYSFLTVGICRDCLRKIQDHYGDQQRLKDEYGPLK